MKTKLSVAILFFLGLAAVSAQTKTNLDVINGLILESVAQADSVLGGKQIVNLTVTTPAAMDILKPKVYEDFNAKGYTIKSGSDPKEKTIDFTLGLAKVEYKDAYSDGILGGTMIVRDVKLEGSFILKNINNTLQPVSFRKLYQDTVKLDDISSIEDQALPFTHSELPSLPLLSNLWEPIIVVGTLIVTVILLFTVRSK